MQLQIEHLQNLRTINFYINLTADNKAMLFYPQNQSNPELIRNIFFGAEIERCLLTPDLLACKYGENADVDDLRLLIMAELEDFEQTAQKIKYENSDVEIFDLAQAVADSYIRPTLNRDKGDVELLGLNGGVLSLKFVGHCAGCPFAQNTLNNVIAKAFNRLIPAIREIRLEE